jgi:hypothetical protein
MALEQEATKTGEARVEAWKDWLLRFSEQPDNFVSCWRSRRVAALSAFAFAVF